jgi:hypothetical protein
MQPTRNSVRFQGDKLAHRLGLRSEQSLSRLLDYRYAAQILDQRRVPTR